MDPSNVIMTTGGVIAFILIAIYFLVEKTAMGKRGEKAEVKFKNVRTTLTGYAGFVWAGSSFIYSQVRHDPVNWEVIVGGILLGLLGMNLEDGSH